MELIDQVINVIHKEKYWGYSVEYYLSSINKCTPSYAAHFYNKHMLSIEQVAELLGMIDDEKKNSFDKVYAEELYLEYNANKYADDSSFIENMKKIFDNKRVLIIAPGKKILEKREEINELLKAEDVISISLNNLEYSTDYLMVTRADFIDEAVKSNSRIIMSSHIARGKYENVSIIDYRNWIIKGEKTYDSAGVMSLNMMRNTNVKEILLAGFDGFSVDINNNYYDKSLRRPVSDEQAYTRNEFYRNMIQDISKEKKIRFITTSLYQEVN
ncbi:MAG: hypothetical protein IKL73_01935 [Lachnospiraceae bacterium]|nr:hypothetical protein [Lachnospiraceae bacterium]